MKFIFTMLAIAGLGGPTFHTESDFEKTLDNYEAWSANVDKPDFYSKITWKNGEKEIKVSDLSDFEKDQFVLIQIHQLSREMYNLKAAWSVELLTPDDSLFTAKLPSSDIAAYLLELQKLRTETASKAELITRQILDKHKDKFSTKEASFITRRLLRWHHVNGLTIK